MTEASRNPFKQCSSLLVPEALRIHFKATELECWLSPESPIVGFGPNRSGLFPRGSRIKRQASRTGRARTSGCIKVLATQITFDFSMWGNQERGAAISVRATKNTRLNAFSTDKVPTFSATPGDGGYQRMQIVCSGITESDRCPSSTEATHAFLANVRVLYVLLPECLPEDQYDPAARALEGSIDKIAKLGGWRASQTTNDGGTSAPAGVADDASRALRSALNKVLPMFPPPDVEDLWRQWEVDHTEHWSCKNKCFYECSGRSDEMQL